MFGRLAAVLAVSALAWGLFVRPSEGAGRERVHVVRAGDTLWSIAERSYAGDPREGVWRLRERNGLDAPLIRPGQRIVVPAG
jgi:LysM repeat protein